MIDCWVRSVHESSLDRCAKILCSECHLLHDDLNTGYRLQFAVFAVSKSADDARDGGRHAAATAARPPPAVRQDLKAVCGTPAARGDSAASDCRVGSVPPASGLYLRPSQKHAYRT